MRRLVIFAAILATLPTTVLAGRQPKRDWKEGVLLESAAVSLAGNSIVVMNRQGGDPSTLGGALNQAQDQAEEAWNRPLVSTT